MFSINKTIDFSKKITEEFLINFLNDKLPIYIKDFMKDNNVSCDLFSNNDILVDEELIHYIDNSFAVCSKDIEEDDDDGFILKHAIYMNYKNIVTLSLDMIDEQDKELMNVFNKYYNNEHTEIEEHILIKEILEKNLMLSFYHELGHIIDDYLYYILDGKYEEKLFDIDTIPPEKVDLYQTYSKTSMEFERFVEKHNLCLSNDDEFYSDDEVYLEVFAELFGIFMMMETFDKEEYKKSFDGFNKEFYPAFINFFEYIMEQFFEKVE